MTHSYLSCAARYLCTTCARDLTVVYESAKRAMSRLIIMRVDTKSHAARKRLATCHMRKELEQKTSRGGRFEAGVGHQRLHAHVDVGGLEGAECGVEEPAI